MFQVSEDKSLYTKDLIENTYSNLVNQSAELFVDIIVYGYTIKKNGPIAKRLANYIVGYKKDEFFVFIPIDIHGNLLNETIKLPINELKKIKISKQWNCEFHAKNYFEIIIPPFSPDINANVGLMVINQKDKTNQFYEMMKQFQ